jgi:O-antigen/teichoic acid export membrane protein
MSRIVRNSVLNGAAMAVTSVLSLVLVPVLVRTYGLDAYGVMPLLRLLTPLGVMGIATLGLPQLAARSVAMHAARGEPDQLRRAQSTIVAVSILLGTCGSAALLGVGEARFAGWLKVGQAQLESFFIGFHAAALLLPLLLPGFVLSVSFTGLGLFRVLRTIEVAVYLLYFAAAVAAVWAGFSILGVVIAFLATDALRALALLAYATRTSMIRIGEVLAPDLRWLASQRGDFAVLTTSGVLGYIRKHVVAVTIPLMFGPAALGLYDAIERVPRALKSLLGLVNTTVLPHAIRLDFAADTERLRALLVRGTRVTLLCILPVGVSAMLYADLIISVWLGQHLAYGGLFLVLLMIPFVLDASLSIVGTATLSRMSLMSHQNRITLVEIVAFVAALAALARAMGESAPYVATALAASVGYALRTRVFLPDYGISGGLWRALLAKVAIGSVAGGACVALAVRIADVPPSLALSTAPVAVLAGAAAVLLLWNADERKDVHSILASLRSMMSLGAGR